MLRVIRTDPKLGDMAGNLDKLYFELLGVQRQYLRVKGITAAPEKDAAKPAEGPRVH